MEKMKWKQYEVEPNHIGRGKFGKVYLAYDPINDRKVAIKVQKFRYYENEVLTMKKYGHHPRLPCLYDHFILNNYGYIVMEFIPGKALGPGVYTVKGKIWEEKETIKFVINVLGALSHLHQLGIVYIDLMPKNIMINGKNIDTVKLVDFGSSQHSNLIEGEVPMTSYDIYYASKLAIYLLKGEIVNPKHLLDMKNKELGEILYKAYKGREYNSAEAFIEKIQPFS